MQRRSATTRYQEAVGPNGLAPNDRIFTLQDFAEFFAELSAEKAAIVVIRVGLKSCQRQLTLAGWRAAIQLTFQDSMGAAGVIS